MAIGDILALKNSLASRLINVLYVLALILIAVMVILGVARGVRIMNRPPMPAMPMAAGAAPAGPQAALPAPSRPGVQDRRMAMRRFMMERRFRRPGPLGMFGMGRNRTLAGSLLILETLVRGAIMVMIVRVLAELGLAVLAMPRRSEI